MSVNINTVNALYANNGNNGAWKPRKTETLTCPSGQVVQVRRPGPEFTLRSGRAAHTFSEAMKRQSEVAKQQAEGIPLEEIGLNALDKLSDEELAAMMLFGRELVCAMLVSPKLVLNPRPGFDEMGPDDIGDDYWFLFNYAMTGFYGLKVPVGDQEVEVSDLASFRRKSGVSGDSVDGAEVRDDAE
jgi:hypothetical protein